MATTDKIDRSLEIKKRKKPWACRSLDLNRKLDESRLSHRSNNHIGIGAIINYDICVSKPIVAPVP
jgi:hypothetical protein